MAESSPSKRTLKEYLYILFTGITMGAADVVPGVSGGTMAFIMGVYEELINAIKSFNITLIRLLLKFDIKGALEQVPWRFLAVLGAGIGGSVIALAGGISWLLEHQTVYLYAFFFGLVIASIITVGAHVRWNLSAVGTFMIGAVVAYLIVGLVPLEMPHDPVTLFLSGAIAIMAMILPGISGSFLLLILGQYAYILEAVKEFQLMTIVPVGMGAVLGIMGFARVLSWLLKRYYQVTITLLVGFMAGSLRKIWPFKETLETMVDRHGEIVPLREKNLLPDFGSAECYIALGLCLLGLVLILLLDRLKNRMQGSGEGSLRA